MERAKECERGYLYILVHSITRICKGSDFLPFFVVFKQTYLLAVAYPISLHVILERLERNYYRSKSALIHDISLILENCISFNEASAPISRSASRLVKIITGFIQEESVVVPNMDVQDDCMYTCNC